MPGRYVSPEGVRYKDRKAYDAYRTKRAEKQIAKEKRRAIRQKISQLPEAKALKAVQEKMDVARQRGITKEERENLRKEWDKAAEAFRAARQAHLGQPTSPTPTLPPPADPVVVDDDVEADLPEPPPLTGGL